MGRLVDADELRRLGSVWGGKRDAPRIEAVSLGAMQLVVQELEPPEPLRPLGDECFKKTDVVIRPTAWWLRDEAHRHRSDPVFIVELLIACR